MCKMGWGAKSIVGVLLFVDRGVLTHQELCMVGWWGSWFLEGVFGVYRHCQRAFL